MQIQKQVTYDDFFCALLYAVVLDILSCSVYVEKKKEGRKKKVIYVRKRMSIGNFLFYPLFDRCTGSIEKCPFIFT